MNLGTMETRFRYFTNDKNAVRFTQPEAYFYLNEAYKYYFARLVSCGYGSLIKSPPSSLNITANDNKVALPSDFLRVRLLERVIDACWYPMKYIENYNYSEDTTSAYGDEIPDYSFIGNNIVLKNTPTESVTGGLRLTYWAYATEMTTSTSTPDSGFNEQWHGMIPVLAAIYAKGGREEHQSAPLVSMLGKMEQPFNDMIDSMTVAYQEAQPFYTGVL